MDRELFEHYLGDASRCGPAPDGAFTGAAGGAACGDLSRLSLTVGEGRIEAVSFETEGCGAIQGFWLRGPGTALDCAYRLGDAPGEACQKVRQTGGTMFDATTQDLRVAVELDKPVGCEPLTLALIRADHSTWFARAKLDGC